MHLGGGTFVSVQKPLVADFEKSAEHMTWFHLIQNFLLHLILDPTTYRIILVNIGKMGWLAIWPNHVVYKVYVLEWLRTMTQGFSFHLIIGLINKTDSSLGEFSSGMSLILWEVEKQGKYYHHFCVFYSWKCSSERIP